MEGNASEIKVGNWYMCAVCQKCRFAIPMYEIFLRLLFLEMEPSSIEMFNVLSAAIRTTIL